MHRTAIIIALLLSFATVGCGEAAAQTGASQEKTDNTSINTLRTKAEQGDAMAQFNLGRMYVEGRGVPLDYATAAYWYRKSAEQGFALAEVTLGDIYYEGQGVPQDKITAAKWYRKAAEHGSALAQYKLGAMYSLGLGMPKDEVAAASWFRKAAEQGFDSAQFVLGINYELGKGVPKNDIVAYALLNIAAATHDRSPAIRDSIAKRMSQQEIAEGQALSRELNRPGNFAKALDAYLTGKHP